MTPYANLGGDSGEAGSDDIKVRFNDQPQVYVYDHSAPGRAAVGHMKQLALAGRGLSTYISQHVRNNYARIE